jgi:hypothetical protein
MSEMILTVNVADDRDKLYEWQSSYKIGKRWESDVLFSVAIDTCGLMIAQVQQFFDVIGIRQPSRTTLFNNQLNLLVPVVAKVTKDELNQVVKMVNKLPSVKIQFDEQHSRPQKSAASIGAAPFVSASALTQDGFVLAVAHEDASKDKLLKGGMVKRSQTALFTTLKKVVKKPIVDIVSDACSSAHTTIKEVFSRSIHESARLSYDLWHELKGYDAELRSLYCTRMKKYSREFKYPQLRDFFETIDHETNTFKMSAAKLKSWWINLAKQVAETPLNDEQRIAGFEYLWRQTAQHYSYKYGLNGDDKVLSSLLF